MWEALAQARGVAGRDTLWQHPDLVPGPEAFADPVGFAGVPDEKSPDAEAFDAALEALLEGEGGEKGGEKGREEPPAAAE